MASITSGTLETAIERGSQCINSLYDFTHGLQPSHVGLSRNNLNKPCPHPPEVNHSFYLHHLLGEALTQENAAKVKSFLYDRFQNLPTTCNQFVDPASALFEDDIENLAFLYAGLIRMEKVGVEDHAPKTAARLILSNRSVEHPGRLRLFHIDSTSNHRHGYTDHVSTSIALRFLYIMGLREDTLPVEEELGRLLSSKEYLQGSRYFHSPDIFLLWFAAAVKEDPKAFEKYSQPIFETALQRLIDDPDAEYPLDVAMRILALRFTKGLTPVKREVLEGIGKKLMQKQRQEDGSWGQDCIWRRFTTGEYFGGVVLPAAFVVTALKLIKGTLEQTPPPAPVVE